jgi:hypothetical protein
MGAVGSLNFGPRATSATVGLALIAVGSLTHASKLPTVSLHLTQTRVTAGTFVDADLVVNNRGSAFKLDQIEKGQYHHCLPTYQIVLTQGSFSYNEGTVSGPCSSVPIYSVKHGITRIPVFFSTKYESCETGTTPSVQEPACLGNGKSPNLPAGTYEVRLSWSEKVPVGSPSPAKLTILS